MDRLDAFHIDMMLIHAPRPWSEMGSTSGNRYFKENLEVWKALEEAYEAGKLRAIGVSNFEQPACWSACGSGGKSNSCAHWACSYGID